MRRGQWACFAIGLLLVVGSAMAAPGRNVLLITVDTLRADRLSCYGSGRGPTPAIDRLAARGVLFERAYAHNPTTLPSHANILSGLTPLAHGVSENAKSVFPADRRTLAGDLKAAGYATAAFVGAFPLDSRFGLNRDFDVYDDDLSATSGQGGELPERPAAEVVRPALAWIARQTGPWFCWIHLWDPHAPYAPPEPYLSRFRDDPYAGEVAYVDAQLGAMFDALAARRSLEGTLIVFTADHGESLGEHGESTHSYFAYNATLRVPLILAGPGLAPRRVAANVSHIDIRPTICELVGLRRPPDLQGQALVGLLRTGRAEDRPIYFESLEPYFDKGCAPLRGFIKGSLKYLDTPIPEVYDLKADPGESRNLAATSDLARLRLELEGIEKALTPPAASRSVRVADAATLERLRSLGYASSPVAQPKASFGPQDDVKTVLPFQQRLEKAIGLGDRGLADDSIRELEALVRDKKDFTPAYVYLARALVARGRIGEAVGRLDDGVRDNPGNYALLSTFGRVLEMAGQDGRAEEVLKAAVSIVDFDPDAWNTLGGIRMRQGDVDKALECFDRAVALDPGFLPGHLNIGGARMALASSRGRDPDELAAAIVAFRKAVALGPASNPALRGLASALTAAGQTGEALAVWERAVAADPRDGFSTYNLGVAYFNAGDRAKARVCFETYLDLKKDSLTAGERARILDLIARCRRAEGRGPSAGGDR